LPPRSSEQTEFLRVRWSIYLEEMLAGSDASRAKLAETLGVPTSRVSQWLTGERGVESMTAFSVGEVLRDSFAIDTSGPDALFAAGHFADLLRLMRAAARDSRAQAGRFTVALYCRLPHRFLKCEVAALAAYPQAIEDYREDRLEQHEAARLKRDARLALSSNVERSTLDSEVAWILAHEGYGEPLARAWQQAQRPLDLLEIPPIPRSVPYGPPPAAGSARLPAIARQAPVSAPYVPPVGPPPSEAIAAVIEAIIALARALERRNPSTTAPRLWRMLAEWAFAVDADAFERFSPLLPSTYAHFVLEN
jgi:hypothetical protein